MPVPLPLGSVPTAEEPSDIPLPPSHTSSYPAPAGASRLPQPPPRIQKDVGVPSAQCGCIKNPSSSSRRLVVAFDGTENQFGPKSSHVVEFYSRIVKSGDQPSYYTSGIGTYVKHSRVTKHVRSFVKNKWASLTAWNFRANLLTGYQWVSENYTQGDQIFILGYSRGAYQARVLAAMITRVGLIRTGNREQIPFAFDVYKNPKSYNKIIRSPSQFKKAFCHEVNIHFVGVWDTVSSVGLFQSKYYPGAQSADNICFLRHALAFDEKRVKFLPEYVVAPRDWFEPGMFGPPRCKEVWFRGCHSDMFNTTSDNGGVPSRWMAYEAMLAGLEMSPLRNLGNEDLKGRRPTNSMTWFYNLVEYIPLKWADDSVSPLMTPNDEDKNRKFKRCGYILFFPFLFDY
ncbi:hypothetical protein GGX14DRAFT_382467 [Mycena pura]|uniref:T6SS Phospholipase effector Tle1-like catalytic domain-containing protein n=1 Tax=Mycena pura TaxID=153505 RepID=A0AAD6ULK5_9AGAR|nr:hypothetical protein GGX14DRAFT_382467 [Mycena pura]